GGGGWGGGGGCGPPGFAVMNWWRKVWLSLWARGRATRSVPPPAANGTMIRTGLSGHAAWAAATFGAASPGAPRATAPDAKRRKSRRRIQSSLQFAWLAYFLVGVVVVRLHAPPRRHRRACKARCAPLPIE